MINLDHPNYQFVAARLLLFSLRKSLYGGRIDLPDLLTQIKNGVEKKIYDADILRKYSEEEIEKVNSFISHGS